MKKLLVLSFVLSAMFFSCGNSENSKKESAKQDTTTSKSTAKEKTYVKVMSYKDFVKNVWDFEANTDEFVFKGEKPCVVDFYATWCGPCKTVAPILEKLAKEYDGKVNFYKVDTDKEQKLAMILKIQYLPTVFFAKNGAQPEKSVGAKDEAFFREQIKKMLGE